MSNLQVQLFGEFCAQYNGQVIEGIHVGRVKELFCYLLLYHYHQHSREALASLMWEDVSTAQAKKCLRHVLWQLQSALECHYESEHAHVLLVTPNWLQINPQVNLWVDVSIFEQTWAALQGVNDEDLEDHQVRALKEAADLYKGNLLVDNYQDWCLRERDRLQNLYIALLSKLMNYHAIHCKYDEALLYGSRILRCDRSLEHIHRQMMHLYYLAGDRPAALKQYRQCVSALGDDLCVQPDQSTQLLYKYILENENDVSASPLALLHPEHGISTAYLHNLLHQLKQVQIDQHILQHRVEQNIATVELLLERMQSAG